MKTFPTASPLTAGPAWRGRLPGIMALWLTLLWLAPLASAQAVEVDGLYEAAVPVTGQGERERRSALRQAFARVLVRVSGDPGAPASDALQEALAKPMAYVQQYRYRPLPSPAASRSRSSTGSEIGNEAEEEAPAFRQELWVSFDPRAVNTLLTEAGLPVWGRARPATLLWLAVNDWGQRFLVGGDVARHLQAQLNVAARRRGLPLFFPLLDLQDQAALQFSDVWGNFQDTLLAASRRYQSAAVLTGRLYHRQDGTWEGRWTLYLDDRPAFWNTAGTDLEAVLNTGVDGAADRLARRYAQHLDPAAGRRITIEVRDVRSLEDYARTTAYLQSLDPVNRLRVVAVTQDKVAFEAAVTGNRENLAQAIAFGGTLAPAEASAPALTPALPRELPLELPLAEGAARIATRTGAQAGSAPHSAPGPKPVLHYRLLP